MSSTTDHATGLDGIRNLVATHLTVGQQPNIIAFVDQLLMLVPELGGITCALRSKSTPDADGSVNTDVLCFQAADNTVCDIELLRGRTLLRSVCARLSVVCAERTGTEKSPYGDSAAFAVKTTSGEVRFDIRFTNTPERQEFEIRAST